MGGSMLGGIVGDIANDDGLGDMSSEDMSSGD